MGLIMPCTCGHQYQDQLYGKRMRVHNEMVKDGKHKGWCCTVCGVKKLD